MRHRRAGLLASALLPLLALVACGGDDTTRADATSSGDAVDPASFIHPPPTSCAYDCKNLAACAENDAPYACPTLDAWDAIPHAASCGDFDGSSPTPTQGACTATAPSGDAVKRTGVDPDDATAFILPDGRRIHPAGREWVLDDLPGGMPSALADVAATPYVLAVETGFGDHAVRSIDTTKLAAGVDPVASLVTFPAPETLSSGVAITGSRVFVGTANGLVQALAFDAATGALARDDASSIPLAKSDFYVAGLAASPNGKLLVVSSVRDKTLLVHSIEAGPGYGALVGSVSVGDDESFTAAFDPYDPSGATVYVSLWAGKKVLAVDLTDPAAPKVEAKYSTNRSPEGLAFLDARWMVAVSAFGEELDVVDRTSGIVTPVPIAFDASGLPGGEPTIPVYDPVTKRLYVALSGENAVAAFAVDLGASPPTFTPLGWVGTGWWPSAVVARADGSLVVANLRGHGGGPVPMPWSFGDNDIGERMRGSVQAVPLPTEAELADGRDRVHKDDAPKALAGAPTIQCPNGVKSDFPVPATNTEGPSSAIQHVFFILRENKNFDALLGDLPGVDGEPSYTLTGDTEEMDAIWKNFRRAARAFSISDDYYTDAVFSTQGHVWATYGRSSDFNERTWALSGARDASPRALPAAGILEIGKPSEGSLFDWLIQNQVPFDILGEADGLPRLADGEPNPLDFQYPGIAQSISGNDLPKACYAAGRARVTCDLKAFTFQTLSNDHTLGVSPDNPRPDVMCAVNDEATGMMLDAISHSPYWEHALVIVTEDDPSQGGEHVDGHRTPIVFVSPWVKRGYVSKTHIDVASLHKLYAHLFGIPYPNVFAANAPLPLDLFTSTPDYTPYELEHRTWPLACGAKTRSAGAHAAEAQPQNDASDEARDDETAEVELTKLWDFSEEDQQPGLGAQVVRTLRHAPLRELTPAMKKRVTRWSARSSRSE